MENTTNQPDPVDGLHLALLQQQRDRLRTRASGRAFGIQEGLMLLLVCIGITLIVLAALGRTQRGQSFAVGTVLIVQGIFLWLMARSTAQHQLKQVEQRIEIESRRTDASVVAEAASAARELLLKG